MFRVSLTPAASCVALLLVSGAAVGETAVAPGDAGSIAPATDTTAAATADALPAIVVTAHHLDEERSHIQTQTGASTYTIDAQAIAATPGGANTLLNQVVLQAPDVAQDSFGQFHVRGEHAGLQYRINGVILPEGIAVFGQTLDPRLISSISLVTGGSHGEIQPSVAYGGGGGSFSYFVTGDFIRDDLGIGSSRRTAARTPFTTTPRNIMGSATSRTS